MLCNISWIDSCGRPSCWELRSSCWELRSSCSELRSTPDTEEAIALAVCYDPRSFGSVGSKPTPICLHHAKLKGKYWKLLPLPGEVMKLSGKVDLFNHECLAHELVREDDRYFRIVPDVVSNSVRHSFPKDADAILDSLRHSGDHWSFQRWGMYVGIEYDGHIHS